MGCDIHAFLEIKTGNDWSLKDDDIWDFRNYGIFGFLADVRNYSQVPPIKPLRGIPDDCSGYVQNLWEEHGDYYHSASWLLLSELLDHDYNQVVWDRRVSRMVKTEYGYYTDGAALAEEGEGEHLTLREFLGEWFLADLERMCRHGSPDKVRIVFWFDN